VLLYGYETLSLTLREEQRMKVFEKRVLRRILGPQGEEMTGGWRKKLHNEELRNLYPSPDVIKMIKPRGIGLAGNIARMGIRELNVGFW
jgi:hypothetical protein